VPFLPRDFRVPARLETPEFRLRPITIHDVVKDYDAVMTSRAHLWEIFGDSWGWPAEDLTLEQDLIDLAWHQKEADLRRAFNYVVVSLDEKRVLGCVYIDPPTKAGIDAEVHLWVRASELGGSLDARLFATVKEWVARDWPFRTVAFPGREISRAMWDATPNLDP
jgi:RimJ/RimL family protein N-acetyltransferase